MKEQIDKTPFRQNKLEKINDAIKKTKKTPAKIIREEMGGKDAKTIERKIKIAKQLFKELKDEYRITQPDTEYIIGHDQHDGKTNYQCTDFVEGEPLNKMDGVKPEKALFFKKRIKEILNSLIKYLEDKNLNQSHFLIDICCEDQYVFGCPPDSQKEDIYLVDLDGFAQEPGSVAYQYLMVYSTHDLKKFIEKAEKIIKDTLPDIRRRFKRLIKNITI